MTADSIKLDADAQARRGFGLALGAYLLWGLLPFYMKAVAHLPLAEVIAHRIVWSVPLAAGVLVWLGRTADFKAALTFKLAHDDLSTYNFIQRLLYAGIIVVGIVIVLSGLSIWKPVQLQYLTALFGGYDVARYVHFICMSLIVLFLIVHVALAILVPKSLRAMIIGR